MARAPSGTVTFLFTDVEGSTKLWDRDHSAMQAALETHDRLLTRAIAAHHGIVFKTVGDAFCAVFHRAIDAVQAAAAIQRAITDGKWSGLPRPIRVRIGVHTGEAQERDNDFYGPALNRVARLEGTAHGGQTVLSLVTAELIRDRLPEGLSLRELGEHRLKDLARPESVFQLDCDGLQTDFPPLRSLDRHPHNLPVQLTPFIGREENIEQICTLLRSGGHVVVTIVGPGGMGKTRTALQVAADLLDSFEDGAFFVDLASATASREFYAAIARVFQVTERPGHSLQDAVTEHLQRKSLLLVLDNFEQIASIAPDIAHLVGVCGDVRCLVTSRVALHIRPEVIYDLSPLSTPRPGGRPTGERPVSDDLTQYESVRLFIDRARAVKPEFQVTNETAPAVAEICHRLDGIPLAIELAAARTRSLSPEAILARLGNRLDLLTGGSLDLPPRQQTLRATMDWSYELLDAQSRVALATLSAFDGLIRLEAAEAILPAADIRGVAVLDVLQALVDQSLLLVAPLDEPEPVYAMLQTVHEYAAEKLGDLETGSAVVERHATYFADLCRTAQDEFDGPHQVRWIRLIWLEVENIRGAVRALRGGRRGEEFAMLATSFAMLLDIKGYSSEALSLLDEAVATAAPGSSAHTKASAFRGSILIDLGRDEEGVRLLEQLLDAGGVDEATRAQAECDTGRGLCHLKRHDEAARMFAAARRRAEGAGLTLVLGRIRFAEGHLALRTGRTARAREAYRAAIELFSQVGHRRQVAQALQNLGIAAYFDGDLDEARDQFSRAATVMNEIGAVRELLIVYNNLGALCIAQERLTEAEKCFTSLMGLAKQTGDKAKLTAGQAGLADSFLAQGRLEEALLAAEDGLRSGAGAGRCPETGLAHRVAGDCYRALGRGPDALREYGEAEMLFDSLGEREELERTRAGIQAVRERK